MPDKTTPPWIAWIADAFQQLGPNYIARPYTDGSYKKLASISGFFRPSTAQVNATASIIPNLFSPYTLLMEQNWSLSRSIPWSISL